jgi:serine phosphatase RsbU (regulator of sigma subunit)
VLEPETGALAYVNGGHEAPILFGPGGVRARLAPTGPAVGMMPDMAFEVGSARLEAGEGLLAFTDGVTDARGASGRYGEARLLALLAGSFPSAAAPLDAIEAAVLAHAAGADQADDITMLAIRRASTG